MMNSKLALFAVLMVATVSFAQTGTAAPNSATPGAQTPPSSSADQSTPQAPPSAATHLPQAKTKEEYDAYTAAAAQTDPTKLEIAADAFAQKYPTSELREFLYVRDMSLYQHANNTDKVIEVGRKAIALNPTNPVPLVNVASAVAESTHDSDLDRDQRMSEAAKDAHAAIDNLDTGLQIPAGTSAERVAEVKGSIQSMAYETLGVVDMNKKDFAAAEQDLLKSAESGKNQPEAVVYLRLSVVQDNLKKYPEALESANKAVKYAAPDSAEQNLAKQQQARIQKLIANSAANSGSAATAPAAPAATPNTPASQQPTASTPPQKDTTPH
jgi:tetratricopeptide (TPR) repeat protein